MLPIRKRFSKDILAVLFILLFTFWREQKVSKKARENKFACLFSHGLLSPALRDRNRRQTIALRDLHVYSINVCLPAVFGHVWLAISLKKRPIFESLWRRAVKIFIFALQILIIKKSRRSEILCYLFCVIISRFKIFYISH